MPETIISQFQRAFNSPIEIYRQVATPTERDNIPSGVRWTGMLVYVVSDGVTYSLSGGGIDNGSWQELGGLQDAPSDGQTYGRKDGNWELIPDGGVDWGDIGGTLANQTDLQSALDSKLSDAPSDGSLYGRKDGIWEKFPVQNNPFPAVDLVDSGGGATYSLSGSSTQSYVVGNFVFVRIRLIGINTSGAATGELRITGLPSSVGATFQNIGISEISGSDLSDSDLSLITATATGVGSSYIYFSKKDGTSIPVNFTAGNIIISGTLITP